MDINRPPTSTLFSLTASATHARWYVVVVIVVVVVVVVVVGVVVAGRERANSVDISLPPTSTLFSLTSPATHAQWSVVVVVIVVVVVVVVVVAVAVVVVTVVVVVTGVAAV